MDDNCKELLIKMMNIGYSLILEARTKGIRGDKFSSITFNTGDGYVTATLKTGEAEFQAYRFDDDPNYVITRKGNEVHIAEEINLEEAIKNT